MRDFYRHNLFRLFTLFFIIVTPFLTILSLGFNPDFSNGQLANTMSVTVETFPNKSTTRLGNQVVLTDNGEIKTGDGKFVQLDIEKEGYQSERFSLWSRTNQNSLAKLTPLYLLPTEFKSVAPIPQQQGKEADFTELLSEDILLSGFDSTYRVFTYNTNSMESNGIEVRNPSAIRLKTDTWQVLLKDIFWSVQNKALLVKKSSIWQLYSFRSLPFEVATVAKVDDSTVLLHDTRQNIWLYDLTTQQFSFLDSKVGGIAFTATPDSIWIWKADSVFQLSRSKEVVEQWNLNQSRRYQNPHLLNINQSDLTYSSNDSPEFSVQNVFQGIAIYVHGYLYYISDFNLESWRFIARDVSVVAVDSNTLFWMNSSGYLLSYNLSEEFEVSFGRIDLDGSVRDQSIFYYDSWKRIFIYSKSQVISIWFNKDAKANSSSAAIIQYTPQQWISNTACYPQLIDRVQFCLHKNELIQYKNLNITPFF